MFINVHLEGAAGSTTATSGAAGEAMYLSVACACVMCMYTHSMTESVAHENSFVHSNRLDHECFCMYTVNMRMS